MKKLLAVALLALAPLAHAEKWMEAGNKSGGRIVLFQTPCKEMPEWRITINTVPNGSTLTGCWTYLAGEVQIRYEDGDLRSYPPSIFRLVDTEAVK